MTNPTDDLPPLLRPEDLPPVRDENELWTTWRRLLGPLGFGSTALWALIMDATGACQPTLPQIEGIPARPDDLSALVGVLGHLVEPGGSIAFLVVAPGHGIGRDFERAWATELARAASAAGLRSHRMFAADDHEVRAVDPLPGHRLTPAG